MNERDLYPVLDCRESDEVRPTALYHLIPIGIGTPHIESLWSYLHRIADAHALRLVDFFRYYLWGMLKRISNSKAAFLLRATNRDGFGTQMAAKVAKHAGHADLSCLTLRQLSEFKAILLNTKDERAWCAKCLHDDLVPYERLEWTIEGVDDCSIHCQPLDRCCRGCGEHQRYTFSNTSLIRCSRCDKDRRAAEPINPQRSDPLGVWKSGQIGGVIAVAHLAGDATIWRRNLATSIRLHGGIKPFARAIGAATGTVKGWRDGRRMTLTFAFAWSWIVSLDLHVLLAKIVPESEFDLRSLPQALKKGRPKCARKDPVDVRSALDVVQGLINKNLHRVPLKREIAAKAGIHTHHAVFRHRSYRDSMAAARQRERLGRCRSRVWRVTADVNKAARRVVRSGLSFTQRNVMTFMEDRGAFAGPLARRYYHWLARRIAHGGSVPADRKPDAAVKYWNANRVAARKSMGEIVR